MLDVATVEISNMKWGDNMRPEPKVGQIYRHFKGNVYEIIAIAKHTESEERLVIYKSGNENATVYARPLEMFLSEVDHEKYRDVEAKYRFTLLDSPKDDESTQTDTVESAGNSGDREEEKLNPLLEEFLDAELIEDKIEIYYKMRDVADRKMLSTVAVSLDIEISKEDVEDQYDEILGCLKMMGRFEGSRLRSRN